MKALLQDGLQAHMPAPPEKRLLINSNRYKPQAGRARPVLYMYIRWTIQYNWLDFDIRCAGMVLFSPSIVKQ